MDIETAGESYEIRDRQTILLASGAGYIGSRATADLGWEPTRSCLSDFVATTWAWRKSFLARG